MINLDPALLDRDKVRKEHRKHLLHLCLAPMIILLVISLFFLSSWFYKFVYFVSYNNNNFPIARDITETRFLINILEPYIPDYNQGVALMRMGEFKKAEQSFEKSIENNPPADRICAVYENLSLSVEKQADSAKIGGQYGNAIELYSYAQSILVSSGCAGEANTDGKSYKSDVANSRISESKKEAIDEMNNTPDDSDSTLDPTREKEVTDDDMDEIEGDTVPSNKAQGLYRLRDDKGASLCRPSDGDKCW